jgi:hypothetical protein
MGEPPVDRLTLALVSAPPICSVAVWLGLLATTAVTGTHPLWNVEARNLSEAAAFGDAGTVVRLAARGADPNRAAEIRGGIISDQPAVLAPIEAAAASRQREMVQLLLDVGATIDDPDLWQRAWCIAGDSTARELLSERQPAGGVAPCADGR